MINQRVWWHIRGHDDQSEDIMANERAWWPLLIAAMVHFVLVCIKMLLLLFNAFLAIVKILNTDFNFSYVRKLVVEKTFKVFAVPNPGWSHPLYCWSHELHVYVNDLVWTHVGPSPGDREGLSVPGVLSVLHGQAILSGYLRLVLADPGVYPHPGLYSVYMLTQTVDSPVLLAPWCEWFDRDPGLFHQLCLHPDLIALLPYDPLPGQGVRGGLGGWEDR